MARRPRKPDPRPVRFVADYNHTEGGLTTAYKEGMVKTVLSSHRRAALGKGRAVEVGDGD